jgi:hypothetical protein
MTRCLSCIAIGAVAGVVLLAVGAFIASEFFDLSLEEF